MLKIQTFRKNVERWKGLLFTVVIDSVKDNEADVLALNADKQLFQKGIDSAGQKVTPRYTPFTASIKSRKGQPTDRVTLKDTGDFHGSFKINYGGDSFKIEATDSKTQKLKAKYGDDILGLTDDSIQDTIEKVKPDVIERSKKIIFSGL